MLKITQLFPIQLLCILCDRPLEPAMAHAIFLSVNDDKEGNLMNKLALINIETMKMAAKKKGMIHNHSALREFEIRLQNASC